MDDVTFICRPAKHGNYYIFHIPNKLIKNDLIKPGTTYKISLESIKKNLQETKSEEK